MERMAMATAMTAPGNGYAFANSAKPVTTVTFRRESARQKNS
jgi:hypothetical protein